MSYVNVGDDDKKRDDFTDLALPFSGAAYKFAFRLTRREEDATELVQETFLRAYRTFASFKNGTNCRAWLFTIVYSIFVNEYHKERRRPNLVSIDDTDESFQKAIAVWDSAAKTEIGPEVDRALDRLPEDFRTAIILVDIEEWTYEEAALILTCPIGTVRSRLFRARKMLFAELQEYAVLNGYAKETHG